MNREEQRMILVCLTEGNQCDKDAPESGYKATVKKTDYLFCCETGFKKSLETFQNSINL